MQFFSGVNRERDIVEADAALIEAIRLRPCHPAAGGAPTARENQGFEARFLAGEILITSRPMTLP